MSSVLTETVSMLSAVSVTSTDTFLVIGDHSILSPAIVISMSVDVILFVPSDVKVTFPVDSFTFKVPPVIVAGSVVMLLFQVMEFRLLTESSSCGSVFPTSIEIHQEEMFGVIFCTGSVSSVSSSVSTELMVTSNLPVSLFFDVIAYPPTICSSVRMLKFNPRETVRVVDELFFIFTVRIGFE